MSGQAAIYLVIFVLAWTGWLLQHGHRLVRQLLEELQRRDEVLGVWKGIAAEDVVRRAISRAVWFTGIYAIASIAVLAAASCFVGIWIGAVVTIAATVPIGALAKKEAARRFP